MRSLRQFEFSLGLSRLEIDSLIENRIDYYQYFKQYKRDKLDNVRMKNGKPLIREFNATSGLLKQTQKRIKTRILDKIPIQECILGGIKGISNIENASRHKDSSYFFQTDISAFFPSIVPKRIYNSLIAKGFSKKIAYYISMLTTCTNQEGREILPQGASTSTSIANIVFERIDLLILSFLPKTAIYTRWVDDLTISSSEPIDCYNTKIIEAISRCGFKAARAKTTSSKNSAIITGVLVINGNLKPTNDTLKKLKELKALDELNRYIGLKNYINSIKKKNRQLITVDKK